MRAKSRQLVAWAAIVSALTAAGAFGQSLRTLDAGGGLYLHQVGDRAAVREPGGGARELPLPPAAVVRRLEALADGWIAAGEIELADQSDLYLLVSESGALRPLPAPPNPEGRPRRGPMPLVEEGRLVGLAWLEGPGVRRSEVRAAAWSGRGWSAAELVSPAGAGTQIAIDGAVLADGSWLLVWAAWDGGDDEILWSRRAGARWSAPAALNEPNEAPDILPAVVAAGNGALAAWNGWDGASYRVRLARFTAAGWRQLGSAGPPTAVDPDLTRRGDGALLLYRVVAPSTWTVHELDARGAILATAAVELETTTQPGLAPRDGSAPALEWPGQRLDEPVRLELDWRAEP